MGDVTSQQRLTIGQCEKKEVLNKPAKAVL